MPSGADIQLTDSTSFLLIGDGGTHKSFFIGTCPSPIYVFDCDNGNAIWTGRTDVHFDLYKEASRGQKLTDWQKAQGWYEWGTAWPAVLRKLNEIGKAIDAGTCQYKTLGIDSLTLLTDICLSYITKSNGGDFKDGRQLWGVFLNNMSELFSQLTAWPLIKVLTAHVKRDENPLQGTTEKLPNVPGQFSGKVGVYFDEVYYTEVKVEGVSPNRTQTFVLRTLQDGTIKQAKSRKFNVPDGTVTDYQAILRWVQGRKK